ncbi:hypothetical protein OIU84_027326 [Salix udensis]|uniref:Uncharacterized protein n=1 Tax=Salix udensis TaxID=889485 RepID=A0AAD6KGY0_9ROSI|nr:hypothetical protein OIU84_027326 [Salix udensis]
MCTGNLESIPSFNIFHEAFALKIPTSTFIVATWQWLASGGLYYPGSYILPSNFEEVATGVLKVLNNLALLDIIFMQRMLVGFLTLECLSLLGYFALFHTENQVVLRWGKCPTILHKVSETNEYLVFCQVILWIKSNWLVGRRRICDPPFVFFGETEPIPVLTGALVAALLWV